MPYEFLEIRVPVGFDEILTKQYGDWHSFVRGGAVHYGNIFDPQKSYRYYNMHPDELKKRSKKL